MTEYTRLTRRGQIRRLRRVAQEALSRYRMPAISLSLLHHAYNTTFLVKGPNSARCVLHVLRPVDGGLQEAERRVRVESELWWLDRVRADLNLSVPLPIRTPGGEGAVSVELNDEEPAWLCTLFHWLDGRSVRQRLTPARLEVVGRTTARLHGHSAELHVPEWFDRPRVDSVGAEEEEEVARLFTDHVSTDAAETIRRALRRVREAEETLGSGRETFGLIHADIHQSNYLFSGRDLRLIDFGDCGWGHYPYDLAVTISELADEARRVELRTALLAGYRQVRDLSPVHEALIDSFVMLREVQNVTWFVRFRDDPSYQMRAAQIGERVAALERQLESEG